MYYNIEYNRPTVDLSLIRDIEKAINGEYSAISCYEQLAKITHDVETRNRILEIRKDEIRHFQVFSQIYTSLSGRQPIPKFVNQCPSEYYAGLVFAFKDEQETVDFYLDVMEKTDIQYIKEQFKRAAADEQNHAVWFLYLLSQR